MMCFFVFYHLLQCNNCFWRHFLSLQKILVLIQSWQLAQYCTCSIAKAWAASIKPIHLFLSYQLKKRNERKNYIQIIHILNKWNESKEELLNHIYCEKFTDNISVCSFCVSYRNISFPFWCRLYRFVLTWRDCHHTPSFWTSRVIRNSRSKEDSVYTWLVTGEWVLRFSRDKKATTSRWYKSTRRHNVR